MQQEQQLSQLSLPQLAALQLHLLHLQQQQHPQQLCSDSWWQQFYAAVSQQAAAAAGSAGAGGDTSAVAQLEAYAVSSNSSSSLTVPQADALCTLLCTSHLLEPNSTVPCGVTAALLQLCTNACRQGRVSAAGALQLLAACCFGAAGREQGGAPLTDAAQSACLALLQQRMARLPSPGGVAVLFACLMSRPAVTQQAAQLTGFVEALSLRLTQVMTGLPTDLLLQVPSVLAALSTGQQQQHQIRARVAATFVLVAQARLAADPQSEAEFAAACAAAGWSLPG